MAAPPGPQDVEDSSPSAISYEGPPAPYADKIKSTAADLYENAASDDEFDQVGVKHRAAAIMSALVEQEDIRIVGPLKSTTIGHELRHPRLAYLVAPFFGVYACVLTVLYIILSLVPILISAVFYRVNWPFTIVTLVLTIAILFVSIPFFYMIAYWSPDKPHQVHQYRLRTVDILLTTYKEDMDVIINTLNHIQRISYSPKFLTVYVLDDGRRDELRDFIDQMNAKGPTYPVKYVIRPNNKGRKGGNINHFIKNYEDSASEFFIVLDADMAPFPEIFDILFGAYYGYEKEERDRIAFIQCPQHFKNIIPSKDWYDIGMTFFYNCVMTCMSSLDCTMYIGTCALWRRSAIVFGGGFHENHATEDTVTGCYVHRTKVDLLDPKSQNWSSKFLNVPIAAGIAPGTLPQQIDQRLRWCLGSVQMFFEHDRFVRAAGLSWTQRVTYFATVGYWVLGIASFTVTFASSLTVLLWIIIRGIVLGVNATTFPAWLLVMQFLAFTLYFAALPVSTQLDKLRAIQMFSTFMPIYIVAYLRFKGFNIKVQTTAADSEEDTRRWHPFMWFHVTVVGITTSMGVAAIVLGKPNAVTLATVLCHTIYWWLNYFPVILSLCGFTQEDMHPRYIKADAEDPMFEMELPSDFETGSETESSSVSSRANHPAPLVQ
mmetsp:Transcript_44970/g.110386  ORF Transcript_44970/g.110386 Transcript_44970/m.110386 type:complete len:658 (+) Transcript_44970:329-2302(+)